MPNKFAGREAVADPATRCRQMHVPSGVATIQRWHDAPRWKRRAHFSRLMARLLSILSTSEAEA